LSGEKKLLLLSEVKWILVPKFPEFGMARLYDLAIKDKQARCYLPEPSGPNSYKNIGRRYLFK
jgi:hypothetical protein